jgi:hypothetical protein
MKDKIALMVKVLEDMEGLKDDLKAIAEQIKQEFQIEPKISKKLAKLVHTNKIQKFEDESDEIKNLLMKVI